MRPRTVEQIMAMKADEFEKFVKTNTARKILTDDEKRKVIGLLDEWSKQPGGWLGVRCDHPALKQTAQIHQLRKG